MLNIELIKKILSLLWLELMALGLLNTLKPTAAKNKPSKTTCEKMAQNYATLRKNYFRVKLVKKILPAYKFLKEWAVTESGDLELISLITFLFHNIYKKADLDEEEKSSLLIVTLACMI